MADNNYHSLYSTEALGTHNTRTYDDSHHEPNVNCSYLILDVLVYLLNRSNKGPASEAFISSSNHPNQCSVVRVIVGKDHRARVTRERKWLPYLIPFAICCHITSDHPLYSGYDLVFENRPWGFVNLLNSVTMIQGILHSGGCMQVVNDSGTQTLSLAPETHTRSCKVSSACNVAGEIAEPGEVEIAWTRVLMFGQSGSNVRIHFLLTRHFGTRSLLG